MSTHTPGPWRVDAADDGLGRVTLSDGAEVGTERRGEFSYLRIEDAHLIAAAPDLLAELKDAVQNAQNYYMLFHDEKWKARIDKWDAAIAKAEGR